MPHASRRICTSTAAHAASSERPNRHGNPRHTLHSNICREPGREIMSLCVLSDAAAAELQTRPKVQKKTLMKMAKQFVIAKELDSKRIENDGDKGIRQVSTDTSSGQTAATITVKKRKTTSARKKQEQGESDCSTSTDLFHQPDAGHESLLCSRPTTAPKNKRQLRKMSSVTQKEDPGLGCDHSEISGNSPAERSTVDVPETKAAKQRGRKPKALNVGLKRSRKHKPLPQICTELTELDNEMTQDLLVSRDEPLLASSSSVRDTIVNRMDMNADKQEQIKSELSELSSRETSSSAVPARKTIRRRRRNNDCDKGTVLSTVSTDTSSDQTSAPMMLRKRKTTSTSNSPAKEESDCNMSTNLLEKSDVAQESLLCSRPATAPKKKRQLRKMSSVTLKNNPGITCGHTEISGNSPAERSTVDVPETQAAKQRKSGKASKVGLKRSRKQKSLPQTFTKLNNGMKQDLLVSHDKHLLAYNGNSLSGQDAIIDGLDLNADKQEHDQSELTELPSEATSSFHQEISPVESVPSAVPARETIKNNHCDKGTVLSTGSTDTLSDKTPPPMMLRKRKTTSIINNQAKEESHCNKSPNPLEKSESLLCSRPATAPTKKRQLRKMSSVTQKEDPGITCDHSEISGNSPAERSTVDVPELTKDLLVTLNESVLACSSSIQGTIVNGEDLNADKQEQIVTHHEPSELPLAAATSFQGEIRLFESAPSAFPAKKTKRRRQKRYKTQWATKKKLQQPQVTAETHLALHGEPRALCCPCCEKKFKSKDELISHFHVHTNNIQSSNAAELNTERADAQQVGNSLDSPVANEDNECFRCSFCLKEFLNQATFKMHRRTHIGKPHTCAVCRKTLRKCSSLNAHEKTHWPVKPDSRSACFKGFRTLQELKRPSRMHSGSSSFSCAGCEEAFISLKSLHAHQAVDLCSEKQGAAHGNPSGMDGFLVSTSVEGQIVTPTYFKCHICKQLHRHWCQYILHLQAHTQGGSSACETCREQCDRTSGMRSHCMVCCRNSGEERECGSALDDIWKEPEAPENREPEPHQDDQGVPPDEGQTGRTSTLPRVESGKEEAADMYSPPPSPGSANPSVHEDFEVVAPTPNSASDWISQQPSGLQSQFRPHSRRLLRNHFGKSFGRWNKLRMHQGFHREPIRTSFSCCRCELEFRFLGLYLDHLREHAAQAPFICLLCSDTFATAENLSTHISDCHNQPDFLKCSTCGKNFSTLRNLKKHKLLHKGTSSHHCVSCNASFSSRSALKTHLKTHGTRPSVPRPAGLVEPRIILYHCGKCTAKFSSIDLLQAHQMCHFTAGKTSESPQESVVSCIPSRAPEDASGAVSEPSQTKRRLPVSKKQQLFRYPHPDRLYVVPVVLSEPPTVISDTEEEQDQRPSTTTSASSTVCPPKYPQRQTGASFYSSDPTILNIPQFSAETARSSGHLHSVPASRQDQDAHGGVSDGGGCYSDEPLIMNETACVVEVFSCVICLEPFTDMSKLHEHYIRHAREKQE